MAATTTTAQDRGGIMINYIICLFKGHEWVEERIPSWIKTYCSRCGEVGETWK